MVTMIPIISKRIIVHCSKNLGDHLHHTIDQEQIIQLFFTDVYCIIFWEQKGITIVTGNQNQQPIDSWIQNHNEKSR